LGVIRLESFAKVNFGLEIVRLRQDGYHDIRSVLTTIGLADAIETEAIDGPQLVVECDDPEIPTDEGNLVVRAARALSGAAGSRRGARIRIEKRIPVSAGLGGGSSNAATVLRALNLLWWAGLDHSKIAQIAATVGSDVPFFLRGGAAVASGRGDRLEPIPDPPPLWIVLVNPGIQVSSAWAYGAYRRAKMELTNAGARINMAISGFRSNDAARIGAGMYNALEPIVFSEYPELRSIKEELLSFSVLGASMSGSGSAIFALAEDEESAREIGQAMEDRGHRTWALSTCHEAARLE
jgi:4-diphosphocytidyl-2-C-methyl-D-erythritol kinase